MPLRARHLNEVMAIEEASFSDPWTRRSFVGELAQNHLACYLVALQDDRVIAYTGAWFVLDEGHITTLAVAAPYRRRHVASHLFKALLDQATTRGVTYLTLEVRPSNTAARAFYKSYGFRELGRRPRYYRDEDALIMTREVPQKPPAAPTRKD